METSCKFSGLRLLDGLGPAAIAAPFLMGGDEEVEEETPFTQTPDSISSIETWLETKIQV